ncbi:hypothetical protein [Streptomyces sp. NPDC093097]|uniref:hypothetical protein n=1 Tax=Streptomyces sp. NPDC093097 TaxID=3366027 RepID=UPI0038189918
MTVSLIVGVGVGGALAGYHVPSPLALLCQIGMALAAHQAVEMTFDGGFSSTYRCQQPGCAFVARVTTNNAGERRRWQEIATDHPHNDWP